MRDDSTPDPAPHGGRALLSGVLLGVGAAAFVDEVVFHQLLHWHHFYDRASLAAGLVSDGILHAFGWFATVAGLFLLADLRRRGGRPGPRWWGGLLLGGGGFQLYDGIVHHKLLRLHQIRYVPDVTPYDLVWNAAAAALLAAGAVVLLRRRGRA
ncbi:MAG TPA: DUF2243 domain-containing protein [Pilimelia sp.]|nr:DUF2243 domain-containing protein [Pilimelia sp.]